MYSERKPGTKAKAAITDIREVTASEIFKDAAWSLTS